MDIKSYLDNQFRHAMQKVGIPPECSPLIALGKPGFGDYQANGAMGAAKIMKQKPRDIAGSIVAALNAGEDTDNAIAQLEIAGPGFINIHLNPEWLGRQLAAGMQKRVDTTEQPQTVVIDYSSPNLAKEMHVGHLRSTIIGDVMARLLTCLGHKVIRQNHVGDWGTQFGMLIAELEDHLQHGEQAELALKDLETFYQQAKVHFDEDESFTTRARQYVVKLQSGEESILKLWQQFRGVSLHHAQDIYQKLNITLTPDDVRGESFYNSDLANVITDLQDKGLVKEDQGAQVVFLEELADKNGNPSVAIVQKRDGGYNYATSDLAAVRYRVNTLQANRIMVVVDARQSLHLKQVFTIARKAGFAPDSVSLEHHAFGTMLGTDGKPFKTRTGGTVKLIDLLDEAVERAEKLITGRESELSAEEKRTIAEKIGIGAVKYFDLSKTRTNDYTFDWDQMLSFEGNTAPYLQYAYTRIRSIFRKAGIEGETVSDESENNGIVINETAEKTLTIKLLQFGETLKQVAQEAYPHVLCNYLYDLASLYMKFYEACPILKDGIDEPVKLSRLRLCHATAETLKTGLDLLGIEVMERM